MSWPAARRPPMSEYLLADAQPAMQDADDRDRRHGQGVEDAGVEVGEVGVGPERHRRRRRAGTRCRRRCTGASLNSAAVGPLGDDVLLLEELADLGEQLQRAVRAGLHGAEPALHEGHHLEQEDGRRTCRRGSSTSDERRRRPAGSVYLPVATGRCRATGRSPVDVPEDEVEAGEDRDDVGHVDAAAAPTARSRCC